MDCFVLLFVMMCIPIFFIWLGQYQSKQDKKRRIEQQQDNDHNDYNAYIELLDLYKDKIETFYVLVESKVSKVDEYGDENWAALDKEVWKFLEKIATASGHVAYGLETIRVWKKAERHAKYFYAGSYGLLKEHLHNGFITYHNNVKAKTKHLDHE